jgi:ABC-type xylose transport system permease subunit
MKYILITFIAGLGLLIPAALGLGLFHLGAPTVFSPLPALTVIPALLLSDWHHLGNAAVILPMLLFFLWNFRMFRGEGKVPRRSYVLLALLAVLAAIDFVVSWRDGLQYEGPKYTVAVCSVNIVWLAFLGLAFARTIKGTTSFAASLFLHWMLFAWLCWYAFPWLGELI